MKNDLSNTATAPVIELPDDVRIPLHSLQADLEYLIGRVIADSSCGSMVVKSMRDRMNQIEEAVHSISERTDAGWRRIETVPETEWGKSFRALVYSKGLGVKDAEIDNYMDYIHVSVGSFHGNAAEHWGVTHWMPSPAPPVDVVSSPVTEKTDG